MGGSESNGTDAASRPSQRTPATQLKSGLQSQHSHSTGTAQSQHSHGNGIKPKPTYNGDPARVRAELDLPEQHRRHTAV